MAFHFAGAFVMGERDGAVLAFQGLAAGAAQHYRGIASAVEEYHDLLVPFQALADRLGQLARDHLFVAGFLELLAHVDDFDLGQGALFYPVGQFDERVFVLGGVEIGFKRGRGRAQDYHRAGHFGAHHSDITGVVTRYAFLLVGRILLFIDDDEGQIGHGSEHCGARADYHAGFSALDAVPLLGAFLVRERGVQNGDFFTENLMKIGSDGGGEADLRDQQDGRAAGFEHCPHSGQVDGRFAGSGDAVHEQACKFMGFYAVADAFEGLLLGAVELKVKGRWPRLYAGNRELLRFFDNLDHSALYQRGESCAGDIQRL